ncbi:lysosome-associated membrane glycoprotein 3-like [Myxocyprinus asiaticus]|uniref:lysosome-associated membrane glycoprotein 3-like n=1 Tax=Myxocyprinus asiaticus TaxID=70543 RepID=UPI0022225C86|nr:lysosome-associated membrane glycoprotein 3-like [Myxocyprinus asiaticus]
MTHTIGLINLSLMLSSLPWSVASADEGPAIINNDARNPIINMSKRPVLQPKESAPLQFTSTLRNPQGKVCLRASLGVEFIVRENKKKYYFNINPSSTQATGHCGNIRSVLSLEFDGGRLEFTFIKEGGVSYVKTIKSLLKPAPPCKNCQKAECWVDFNKRMIPIILGAVAAAICLIAILTYVLVRERHRQGYEQL